MKTRIYALALAMMLALSVNTFAADEKKSCDMKDKTAACDKENKDCKECKDCCKKECDHKDHSTCQHETAKKTE